MEFKRGDRVLVKDCGDKERKKRIYLTHIEGAGYPYLVVDIVDEDKFKEGKGFDYSNYEEIKLLPEVEEMTLGEICKELGREVKIIK